MFDKGNVVDAAFVGSGKLFQSRVVKVGDYYRIYAALTARPNGNRVIYSDDFGRSWHALGGAAALPVPGGDEPKCEELPDGRVIITSRASGCRLLNIYTYSNTKTGEGCWDKPEKATMDGLALAPSTNPTNGEMLIVPAMRNSDGKPMYVALQSVPTGTGRNNVSIFYKELASPDDMRNVKAFAEGWDGCYQVSTTVSMYSSMDLQADDRIAFFYEETLTRWGTKPNPVCTSFPQGEGEHNYDGCELVYKSFDLETITDGKYCVNRRINRGKFLKAYYEDIVDSFVLTAAQKRKVKDVIKRLPAEPTSAQMDAILEGEVR